MVPDVLGGVIADEPFVGHLAGHFHQPTVVFPVPASSSVPGIADHGSIDEILMGGPDFRALRNDVGDVRTDLFIGGFGSRIDFGFDGLGSDCYPPTPTLTGLGEKTDLTFFTQSVGGVTDLILGQSRLGYQLFAGIALGGASQHGHDDLGLAPVSWLVLSGYFSFEFGVGGSGWLGAGKLSYDFVHGFGRRFAAWEHVLDAEESLAGFIQLVFVPFDDGLQFDGDGFGGLFRWWAHGGRIHPRSVGQSGMHSQRVVEKIYSLSTVLTKESAFQVMSTRFQT